MRSTQWKRKNKDNIEYQWNKELVVWKINKVEKSTVRLRRKKRRYWLSITGLREKIPLQIAQTWKG